MPDALTSQQAAASILQGMTAHYLLFATFVPQFGDKVLIHAGAGGTGLLLIQMAKRLGTHVITTVSTEEKAALARAAGADHVIVYRNEDVVARVHEITGGEGLPVVYDSVGKGHLRVFAALPLPSRHARPLRRSIRCRTSVRSHPPVHHGSLYVTRPTLKDYVATRDDLEQRAREVFRWVADGSLTIRTEHTYKLESAAQAHRDLESRMTTGKLLLIP